MPRPTISKDTASKNDCSFCGEWRCCCAEAYDLGRAEALREAAEYLRALTTMFWDSYEAERDVADAANDIERDEMTEGEK